MAEMDWKALPRADFKWKALCVPALTTSEEIKEMVDLVHRMGFNAIIFQTKSGHRCWYNSEILEKSCSPEIDPLAEVIKEAHKRGMEVYAWIVYLYNSGTDKLLKEHPEYYQVIKPGEEKKINMPRVNPDRVNIHGGNWLCPDRGLVDYEKEITREIIEKYPVEGIFVDYLGYRNYYACFCDYSKEKRAEFAKRHPELSDQEMMGRFSEESLVEWSRQLRAFVKSTAPDMKISIHVYPDFDPDPEYGNRLHVDYCGQTVAWFYKPFWSYEKVHEKVVGYMRAAGKHHSCNEHVSFVGVYSGELLKSPERLRTEIRIAGSSGAKSIMLAFYKTLLKHEELARTVSAELGGHYQR